MNNKLRIFPKKVDVSKNLSLEESQREKLQNNELFINSSENNIWIYKDNKYLSLIDTIDVKEAKGSYEGVGSPKESILNIINIVLSPNEFYNGEIYKYNRYLDVVKDYKVGHNSTYSDWFRCPESFMLDIESNKSNIFKINIPNKDIYEMYFKEFIYNKYTHIVFKVSYDIANVIDKTEGVEWHTDYLNIYVNQVIGGLDYPMNVKKESSYITNVNGINRMNVIFKASIFKTMLSSLDYNAFDYISFEYVDNANYGGKRNIIYRENNDFNKMNLEISYYGVNKYSEYNINKDNDYSVSLDNIV